MPPPPMAISGGRKETITVYSRDGSQQLVSLTPAVRASQVVHALIKKQKIDPATAQHFELYCWLSGKLSTDAELYKLNSNDRPYNVQIQSVTAEGNTTVVSTRPRFVIMDAREQQRLVDARQAEGAPTGRSLRVLTQTSASRAQELVMPLIQGLLPGDKAGYVLLEVSDDDTAHEDRIMTGSASSEIEGRGTGPAPAAVWERYWLLLRSGRLWRCPSHFESNGMIEIPLAHSTVIDITTEMKKNKNKATNNADTGNVDAAVPHFEIQTNQQAYKLRSLPATESVKWVNALMQHIRIADENELIQLAGLITADEEQAAWTTAMAALKVNNDDDNNNNNNTVKTTPDAQDSLASS